MTLNIARHLDKNNLHHAYLIEGTRDEIVPEVVRFLEDLGINTTSNPDYVHITIDNLRIDEAFDLRAMSSNKGFSLGKKIFVICANNFSLDAQNVLLKMFEEPIENTHFFLIVPDTNALLKTLISRFYLITPKPGLGVGITEAGKFISMPLKDRIDFIKELLTEPEEEDEEGNASPVAGLRPREIITLDSTRSKALRFLNSLEALLHSKFVKDFEHGRFHPEDGVKWKNSLQTCLNHFFKVREFLRMPGSSAKSLLESVALVIPSF